MRRLIQILAALCLVTALLAGSAACKRRKRKNDEPAGPVSMIQVADPRATTQLMRGFHGVEAAAWRWTEKSFAVSLKPPKNANVNGAALVVQLAVPEVSLKAMGPLTLSAKVGGVALEPEKFEQAGDAEYRRDVPASALAGDMVNVEFTLDKAIAPTAQDQRELGIIVKMVGFEAKQ